MSAIGSMGLHLSDHWQCERKQEGRHLLRIVIVGLFKRHSNTTRYPHNVEMYYRGLSIPLVGLGPQRRSIAHWAIQHGEQSYELAALAKDLLALKIDVDWKAEITGGSANVRVVGEEVGSRLAQVIQEQDEIEYESLGTYLDGAVLERTVANPGYSLGFFKVPLNISKASK